MAKEARSAKLAITISYPTSSSGIIVLLKISKELQYLSSPALSSLTRTPSIFLVHVV